jgi:hypothetical protein
VVWTADGFIPTADSELFTADGGGPVIVSVSASNNSPVFVDEDTIYREFRRDHSSLLFWRKAAPVVPLPAFILQPKRPPPELFEIPFSVYAKTELPSQQSLGQGLPTTLLQFRPAVFVPDPEPEFNRANHQVYFQLVHYYVGQMVGYTWTQPDFCDDPWLDPMPRGKDASAALFPFRQPAVIPPVQQQYNLYFNQPKPWPVDAEEDTVNRKANYGVMFFPRPQQLPPPQNPMLYYNQPRPWLVESEPDIIRKADPGLMLIYARPPPFIPITKVKKRRVTRVILPPKRLGEIVTFNQFDFISQLGPNEVISFTTATVTVYSGTDPTPSNILNGLPLVNGTAVLQSVRGGVLGTIYEITVTAFTNAGQDLQLAGFLAIIPDVI